MRNPLRVLGSTVLTLEAIVVLLSIPVALAVTKPERPALVGWSLALLALVSLLAVGVITKPYGPMVGWVVQALVIASGFLVPAMFALGVVFALLWFVALRLSAGSQSG